MSNSEKHRNFILFGYDYYDLAFREYPKLEEFYKKYSKLKVYHAVPNQYNDKFKRGYIVLKSAKKIRETEDPEEGKSYIGNIEYQNKLHPQFIYTSSHLFCMSLSKNITKIRQKISGDSSRVLYKVNLSKFIEILKKQHKTPNFFNINIDSNEEYEKSVNIEEISIFSAWAQFVNYNDYYSNRHIDDISPPESGKKIECKDECELRLAFDMKAYLGAGRGSVSGLGKDIFFQLSPKDQKEIFNEVK